MDASTGSERPLVIGPSGSNRRLVRIVVSVAVLVAALAAGSLLWEGGPADLTSAFAPGMAGMLAVLVANGLLSLRTTVTVDDRGVRVQGAPSRRGVWTWDELLEVGWFCQTRLVFFTVRPRGSTWDLPGPTSPVQVSPPLGRRDSVDEIAEALAAICARHDVSFTRTPAAAGSAPPGSPLRD